MLQRKEIIWQPKIGTNRENLGNTAQLDSTIGRWRRALRKERIGDAKCHEYVDVATEAANQTISRTSRNATPADALEDEENPLLAFQQSEKTYEHMGKNQKKNEKVKENLDKKKAKLSENQCRYEAKGFALSPERGILTIYQL